MSDPRPKKEEREEANDYGYQIMSLQHPYSTGYKQPAPGDREQHFPFIGIDDDTLGC